MITAACSSGRWLRVAGALALSVTLVTTTSSSFDSAEQEGTRKPDVFYMPTPQVVVDAMLAMAAVTSRDVVYDLGSGDGRIPITAARVYGAHGIGIDIDPDRVQEATVNARTANVTDKVRFLSADLFTTDISAATVVTLFLTPGLNTRLLSKLNRELKPGTRVVSHRWEMKDTDGFEYQPREKKLVEGSLVYLWTIPFRR